MQTNDVALLQTILEAIVASPDKVTVERTVDEMGVLLKVKVDEKDAGAVIGKAGATIAAIRKLMGVFGRKNNARINIKLDVPPRKKLKTYEKPSTEDQNHDTGKL